MWQYDLKTAKTKLKYIRELKGVTKTELDEAGIVSRRHMQKIEDVNKIDFLSVAKLYDLANYLDISINYLFGAGLKLDGNINKHELTFMLVEFIESSFLKIEIKKDNDGNDHLIFDCSDKDIILGVKDYLGLRKIKDLFDKKTYDGFIEKYVLKFDGSLK